MIGQGRDKRCRVRGVIEQGKDKRCRIRGVIGQGRDKRCRVGGVIVMKLLGTGWTDKRTILLDNRCHVADL